MWSLKRKYISATLKLRDLTLSLCLCASPILKILKVFSRVISTSRSLKKRSQEAAEEGEEGDPGGGDNQ
jgi:hypothetical protein